MRYKKNPILPHRAKHGLSSSSYIISNGIKTLCKTQKGLRPTVCFEIDRCIIPFISNQSADGGKPAVPSSTSTSPLRRPRVQKQLSSKDVRWSFLVSSEIFLEIWILRLYRSEYPIHVIQALTSPTEDHPATVTPLPSGSGEPPVFGPPPADARPAVPRPSTTQPPLVDAIRAQLILCNLFGRDQTFATDLFIKYARAKPGEAVAILEAMARGDEGTKQGVVDLLKNLCAVDENAAIDLFSLLVRPQSSSLENSATLRQFQTTRTSNISAVEVIDLGEYSSHTCQLMSSNWCFCASFDLLSSFAG